MALFYHGLNQTELALRHMSRALLLLSLSSGPDHPDVAATYINVAMMYQDIGKMNTALRYLQEALKKNERLLGEEHIQTAVCYHALAIAFNCMGAFKLSHQVCVVGLLVFSSNSGWLTDFYIWCCSMRRKHMIYSSNSLVKRILGLGTHKTG
jgi:tetratricopeptide (TPR) repeat protein